MDSLSSPLTTVVLSQAFDAKSTFIELNHDLIFDASSVTIDDSFVAEYTHFVHSIASDRCSRVLVVQSKFLSLFSDAFVVVPTILEAQDFIEMERIERDLGF